jgi:hypothetical protein
MRKPTTGLPATNNHRTTSMDASDDGHFDDEYDDKYDFLTDISDEYRPENVIDGVHHDSDDLHEMDLDNDNTNRETENEFWNGSNIDKNNRSNKTAPSSSQSSSHPDLDDADIFDVPNQAVPRSPKKPKAKTDRKSTAPSTPTATATPKLTSANTYIDIARQKAITQNMVAANYKNDGFELAYVKHLRATAKVLDWSKDFTIRNILPAKNDHTQLLAYLVW